MNALPPLAVALVATFAAGLRLLSLAALGTALVPRSLQPCIAVPLRILVAGGVLGALYAVLLRAGLVPVAIAADMVLAVVALAWRGAQATRDMRALASSLRAALAGRSVALAIALLILVVYWVAAAAPPRDTDTLRYHLAHIAQIDREGAWKPLPIIHYAFPFGWQALYLPFVRLRIPEAAQLLNLGLWITALGAIVSWRPRERLGATALLLLGALCMQPLVAGSATTAAVDQYTTFAVLATALFLASPALRDASSLRALGFVAWIALQSRYQAFAIGAGASAVVIALAIGGRLPWARTADFALGASCALLLASPFYIVNLSAFGNPVWPLMTPFLGEASYATTVAGAFTNAWSGEASAATWIRALVRLASDRLAFPLPLLVIATALYGLRRSSQARPLAVFVLTYLCVWAMAQPVLYPRFIIYLLPAALLVALQALALVDARPPLRIAARATLAAALLVFSAYALASASFAARYMVGMSDLAELHRFTWYWPVYSWIGAALPADARLLVIVRSAETLHLDRYYRRADPGTSAVVDWKGVADADALVSLLRRERLDHVIYEQADWAHAPGGPRMTRLVAAAVESGALVEAGSFPLELTRSRFRGRPFTSTVVVYRVR